ncbi:MAG: HAD family hydrolase [Lachnospiraceae bacterium]|nr:HAD family hydrolase [Lachnospiraceae bacterium]
MKKVFASDFDGTLYFYKAEVKLPPENVKKILEYQAAGHIFGLCTGRQVGGLTPFITGHFVPDFMITSTGSNIVDKDMKEIRRLQIDRDVISEIIKLVRPRGNRISIDIDGVINVFEKMDYPGAYNVITGMDDAPKGMVHGVGIHCETLEEAAALTKELNDKFGQALNAFQNVVEVDIAPKGCSKGAGVEAVRKYYGDCKVYGIGDSLNDLPLLLKSDVSYTFPYAPKEVQDQVTKVVDTLVDALEDSMQDEI